MTQSPAPGREPTMAAMTKPAATPSTKRYQLTFADGKGATVLDMTSDDTVTAVLGFKGMFGDRLVHVEAVA